MVLVGGCIPSPPNHGPATGGHLNTLPHPIEYTGWIQIVISLLKF